MSGSWGGSVVPLVEDESDRPSRAHRVRFGAFEIDLDSGELRKSGLRVRLQEKPFQILFLLLEQPGQLVTREQLQRRLWPADSFVDFDRSLNTAANRLRQALGDSADHPRFIETLPRRGYRWIGPFEPLPEPAAQENLRPAALRQGAGISAIHPGETAEPTRTWSSWLLALLIIALAAAALVGFTLWSSRSSRQAPPAGRALLLVLPFENQTGNPGYAHVASSLDDEMITQLSGLNPEHLGVIARVAGSPTGKQDESPEGLARALGADYVLTGAIGIVEGRIVVSTQLLDVRESATVWNGTYERDLTDLLSLRRDVAARIAADLRNRMKPAV